MPPYMCGQGVDSHPRLLGGRLFAGMTVVEGGLTLTPALSRQGRGGKRSLPLTLFSCVVGLRSTRVASGRGVVESMGPVQGSGSCQCCSSLSLILRSEMVSSAGAGFSSFSSSMRSDPRAFLRMAALAFPSRRRCVRVRRVRGRRAGRVLSFEFLVSSWEPGSGSRGWVPAPYRVRGRLFAGTTVVCAGTTGELGSG